MLLVYISADGLKFDDLSDVGMKSIEGEQSVGAGKRTNRALNEVRSRGGVTMSEGGTSGNTKQQYETDEVSSVCIPHCLYPEDLLPFARKKLFLIVESDNSAAFRVCLHAPSPMHFEITWCHPPDHGKCVRTTILESTLSRFNCSTTK